MEKFNNLIRETVTVWSLVFLMSVLMGAIYAAQLVGFSLFDNTLLNAQTTRSLHITLMLYGPIMLAMSLLPFALFAKEGLDLEVAVVPLRNYFLLWHLFLFMAVLSILLGLQRGLPFYDFTYELNFLLAGSGIFYIIAIFKTIKQYEVQPPWVKVAKALLFVAPVALLVLMNPSYGQVEKTLIGPHGDNTLGMSFTLIPLFYLLVKLHAKQEFKPRMNFLWVLPLVAYFISVGTRIFRGDLAYEEEWVYQWMTFFYLPLLLLWCKDAGLSLKRTPYLKVSIWAFLFVMIQGNILFFPDVRAAFHKNDLVIAHAHVAMAIGILFMALSTLSYFYKIPKMFMHFWLWVVALIFIPLTLAGFEEAGFFTVNIIAMWWVRLVAGILGVLGLIYLIVSQIKFKKPSLLQLYHLNGFASDGLGAVLLILFGSALFPLIGFHFSPYYYLVFGFMGFVGILHLVAVFKEANFLALMTSLARFITGTMFLSLSWLGTLDSLGFLVGAYDIGYGLVYLLFRERF